MNTQVEEYISKAVKAVEKHLAKDNKVAGEYKGYISALGASLIQSGLLPTLAFYSRNVETANTNEDRSLVLKAILYILQGHNRVSNSSNLFRYACGLQSEGNISQLNILQQDIINAAIALKLAIRTFEFTKSEK